MVKKHSTYRSADEHMHIEQALGRFRDAIAGELRSTLDQVAGDPDLRGFYGQMAYHLGWVDESLNPAELPPGKLMRPALVLWACELAASATGADVKSREHLVAQALPVAAAIELVHNFSLIHDDIEDHDELRRHRRTLWSVWGEAQGINTGDGMFCLARLALWNSLDRGLTGNRAAKLAMVLDRTCLRLCEGQYLDMSFESQASVTPTMYLDMIACKTGALMRGATEMGAMVGAPKSPTTIAALATFGEALGQAFQLRDDLLGIWAESEHLGKSEAGDLRRKKMSLPVIHAMANAAPESSERLRAIYQERGPASDEQIAEMRDVLDVTSRAWCQARLAEHCREAREALDRACEGAPRDAIVAPAAALGSLLDFIEIAVRS